MQIPGEGKAFISVTDLVNSGYGSRNSIIKDIEDRGLDASIVINGIETGKGYGYGRYKYGYGYGGYGYGGYGKYGAYGDGYYGEETGKKKKGLFSKKS